MHMEEKRDGTGKADLFFPVPFLGGDANNLFNLRLLSSARRCIHIL